MTATAATFQASVSDKPIIRIQAISGLVFAVFLVLHLANMCAALFGQAAYDGFMSAMRWYYQSPLVELSAVLGAATVHMGAAVVRISQRRARAKSKTNASWRVRLHRYSGYYIMAAFFGHVIATRVPGLLGHPADFSFVNFSLTYAGVFFYPYYFLFALSGLYHLTHGTVVALRIVGARLPKWMTAPRSRAFWTWTVACSLMALFGVLAIGGQLYSPDQARFEEWKQFAGDYVPESLQPW